MTNERATERARAAEEEEVRREEDIKRYEWEKGFRKTALKK